MRLFNLLHRHTVRNLGHPVRGQKARQEDIGIREIQLFLACVAQPWRNLKPSALLPVEQGGKNGGRVEVGKGHKVDRAIHPHQGDGIEIPDDAVVFNGLIPSGGYIDHTASPSLTPPSRGGVCAAPGPVHARPPRPRSSIPPPAGAPALRDGAVSALKGDCSVCRTSTHGARDDAERWLDRLTDF
jgi:hypothetical protein